MQTHHVRLENPISDSFRCQRAANSLDIDVTKKSIHELKIEVDLETPYSVGLIVGSSGSGKTTLAKQIFGQDCFKSVLDESKPIIEQFPEFMSYDECATILNGIGLSAVTCWIRPACTLSNGQKARAEAALAMISSEHPIVLDEWTSVVDRTVAKAMSHCIQKFARKNRRRVVLNSCHYDVLEWLNPDWIIDCNKSEFIDRRSLRPDERVRKEKIQFDVREVDRSTWKYFSKYHYLSERLPGGRIYLFGLFHENDQIGFQCFANYVPTRRGKIAIYHFNRTVVHPDYCGLGLGIHLINATSSVMRERYHYRIMGKFSSTPVYKSLIKDHRWELFETRRQIGSMQVGNMGRVRRTAPMSQTMKNSGGEFRTNVKTYSFEFFG